MKLQNLTTCWRKLSPNLTVIDVIIINNIKAGEAFNKTHNAKAYGKI